MSSSETLELDSGLSKIGRLRIALGHPLQGRSSEYGQGTWPNAEDC